VKRKRDTPENSIDRVAGQVGRGFTGRPGDPSQCQKCGAKTRAGGACRKPAEVNPHTGRRLRCRLHAGWSSGPRTEAGKAAIAAAAFRHGRRTKAAAAAKRELRAKLQHLKQGAESLSLSSGKTISHYPESSNDTNQENTR
jgi:hypothetical protein